MASTPANAIDVSTSGAVSFNGTSFTGGTLTVANGGTGIATTTAYGVICGGTTSTGALQNAGAGSSGQVLVSGGSSALPSFSASSGVGSLVKITTVTASSSSSLTITSGITSTYRNYLLVFDGVVGSTNANLLVRYSSNGGSSYISSGYTSGVNLYSYNSSTAVRNTNIATGVILADALATTNTNAGSVYLFNLTTSNIITNGGTSVVQDGSISYYYQIAGSYNTGTAMNALEILPSAGNMTTGNFTLFGIVG